MQRTCVLFAALHQAENHCCDASSTACLGCFDVRNARHAIVCLTRIACAQGWQLSCFRLVCTTLPTQPGAADPTLWCGSALHVCWLAALACTVTQFVQLRLWHRYLCVCILAGAGCLQCPSAAWHGNQQQVACVSLEKVWPSLPK